MVALRVNNLHLRYGSTPVLDGVSLTVAQGDIACLLGASGCGKTSLMRTIAGFQAPSSGEIELLGTPVTGKAWVKPEKRGVGMVFQDHALFPHLNAIDNVRFGIAGKRRERNATAERMLELVGLSDFAKRMPDALSGGQQQRLALARALAPEPRLLLLDEPFSSLDRELREQLNRQVRDLLKELGVTAILVTHDQLEAFAMADHVGVMRNGQIEQWATPYDLYHEPATRYVADFVGQGAMMPAKVIGPRQLDTELGTMTTNDIGLAVGSRAEVLLRPDDIEHDDEGPNWAIVRDKAFRGAEILMTLELASGLQVVSLFPSHHNHQIGEKVGFRLDTQHVVAFPA